VGGGASVRRSTPSISRFGFEQGGESLGKLTATVNPPSERGWTSRRRSVRFGDLRDNRQAKAESVWAGRSIRDGALEGLEQSADLVWRYVGSGVGHDERRAQGASCKLDLDVSAGDVVTNRVVDEVRRQSVKKTGVPRHLDIIEGRVDL
jgi:hypothetical protein